MAPGLTRATARPAGALVWCHVPDPARQSAVVGLAQDLATEGDQITLLLTTGEDTGGAAPIHGHANDAGTPPPGTDPRGLIRTIAPVDQTGAIRAFLRHWRPDVAVWLGGTLVPRMVTECARSGAQLILADAAHETLRSPGRLWGTRVPRSSLSQFGHILCADAATAERLAKADLGGPIAEHTGRIDAGHSVLGCVEADRAELAASFASRPRWLAADPVTVGADEELTALATAHRIASHRAHRLLMLVATEATTSVATHFADRGFAIADRAAGQEPTEATEVLIGDIADLGLFYRLAPVTFLGGSLTEGIRRNPFEAAGLGSALLHGPATSPHAGAAARLDAAGAARAVRGGDDLGATLERLLSPDRAALLAHAAWDVASRGAAATGRLLTLIRAATDQST